MPEVRDTSDATKGSSPRTSDELLDAWYRSVSEDGFEDDDAQTIGLFGGRSKTSDGYESSRSSRLKRVREILSIVRRYDIFHGLTPKSLRHMLEELGPTFVKAGQILSMRSEILPESFCRELTKLRSDVEPTDRDTVLQALRDEYDTPIQQGYQKDYYDKVIRFMRNLFSGGFKDNQHLSFGFLTGILRVAKESIFSGMNNLSINSVLDNKYSAYFGFTADEVMEMAEYYGAADKYDEICQWYDGYRFGKTEIFNPWSVVNYFSNECEPRPFWVSTGSNDIIGEVLAQADEEIYNRLTSLVNGETFTTFIDTGVIYPQIKSNPSTIYSFLLVTGYLKALKTTPSFSGDFMCEVSLPNREISLVYNKEILQRLENLIPPSTAISVQEAIFSGDNARLKAQIQTLLTQSVSSFDTAGENFYHGFMLGLCALLGGAFVTSNRESGDGRYDIQLKPTQKGLPGILIELKAEKNCSDEKMKKLSETALQQINDKKYETELTTAGVRTIYKYGVAFSGKKVEVAVG